MIRFHALVTHLYDELGHRYVYHLCFRQAIKKLGLSYKGYANKISDVEYIPQDWECNLAWKDEQKAPKKILQFFKRAFGFSSIFRRKIPKGETRIFFLESLCMTDIVALTLSWLFFSKKNDFFWLLLRYDLRYNPFKWKVHRLCLRLLQIKMKKRLIFLTDSEPVGQFFEQRLHQPVHLVPIPHTTIRKSQKHTSDKIILWWPGRPAPDKGAAEIKQLLMQMGEYPVQLNLSEDAKKWIQELNISLPIKFLNTILSRDEYNLQFDLCTGILLPYDPKIYYSRTSGIFVEAVFAGKLPFVRKGSWLANELCKHELSELILDWSRPDLLNHIVSLLKDQKVQEKFRKMHQAYVAYHSLPTYTEELRKILKSSQIDCT